jgi:hypothetical protein
MNPTVRENYCCGLSEANTDLVQRISSTGLMIRSFRHCHLRIRVKFSMSRGIVVSPGKHFVAVEVLAITKTWVKKYT